MFKFIREFKDLDGEVLTNISQVANDSMSMSELKNMFIDFCKGCGYHPDSVKEVLGDYEEL